MYINFVFTEVVTTITLRMMKSVIQSGYKTVHRFLPITYSLKKANNTQHTTTVINTGQDHSTVGEGHCVSSERCCLRWQILTTMLWCPCCLYAPLVSPDNIAFCDCMEELFHMSFPLLVSLAVGGISWYEKFLELLKQFKIT